jgi:hypothetical protein
VLAYLRETDTLSCVDSEYLTKEVLHLLSAILDTFLSGVCHCFFITEIFRELTEFIVFYFDRPIRVDF